MAKLRLDFIAQAAQAPRDGASNATDFQPPTRNPQNEPVNTQEQSGGVQQTGDEQILNNPNAHIEVPVDPAEPGSQTVAEARSINWPIVIGLTVVIVVLAEYIIRRKEKQGTPSSSTRPAVELSPEEILITPEEKEEAPEPAADTESAPEKPKKKKSKSKRKKK